MKYGEALFEAELAKSEKIKEKVFEITRTLLVKSSSGVNAGVNEI